MDNPSRRRQHLRVDSGGAYSGRPRGCPPRACRKSTIHYWARKEILVPSVSQERLKLWSYSDLLSLRVIYWLRQPKAVDGRSVPSTAMRAVRRALAELASLDIGLFERGRPTVNVDRAGEVYVVAYEQPQTISGQIASSDLIDLVAPFSLDDEIRGPDLVEPARFVRIRPGKLSGAPSRR